MNLRKFSSRSSAVQFFAFPAIIIHDRKSDQFWIDFGWILGGFWVIFGIIFRALYPIGFQERSKSDFYCFWEDFGLQDGGPRGPPELVLEVYFGLGRVLGPRWPQDPSRDLPRLIFLDFGPQLGGFWSPT